MEVMSLLFTDVMTTRNLLMAETMREVHHLNGLLMTYSAENDKARKWLELRQTEVKNILIPLKMVIV